MFGALLLFEDEFIHVVSISFTALILTELIMVALTIRTWHWLMMLAELISLIIYVLSLIILRDFFGKLMTPVQAPKVEVSQHVQCVSDAEFIQTWGFIWKTVVITAVSCLPLYIVKFLRKKFSPPSYQKLS